MATSEHTPGPPCGMTYHDYVAAHVLANHLSNAHSGLMLAEPERLSVAARLAIKAADALVEELAMRDAEADVLVRELERGRNQGDDDGDE